MLAELHFREPLFGVRLTNVHKDKLTHNFPQLVRSVHNTSEIADYLLAKECITEDERQVIASMPIRNNQTRSLIDVISRRSEGAFYAFLDALEDTQETPELYNLLRDDATTCRLNLMFKGPPITGDAKNYHLNLLDFHQSKLGRLAREQPTRHDLKSYIKLALYPRTTQLQEMRTGFREMTLDLIRTLGTEIQPDELFEPELGQVEGRVPRTVLMLGAPGVGKTATMYHFLKECIEGNLWKNRFHFIFFILFREVNHFEDDISFHGLLFNCYGPSPVDENKIWKYLERNQQHTLCVLDGYDEGTGLGVKVKDNYKVIFHHVTKTTKPQILLHNLIAGNILPDAKVLVTSRPHCAELLKNMVDRTVELGGIDAERLNEMVQKALQDKPLLIPGLQEYLKQHNNVVSLCSVPANACGFLEHVKWSHRNVTNEGLKEEYLPQTRAALLFVLTLSLLHNHDRQLQRDLGVSHNVILQSKKETIQKLTQLAIRGLFDGDEVQQLFSQGDIERCGLSVDEATSSGIMSGHVSSVADTFWPVTKIFLNFPHLIFEEFFGALGISQAPADEILSVLWTNQGDGDMVSQLCLGLHGDPMCQELLACLYPRNTPEALTQRAQQMLKVVWSSPRRYHGNGALFCISTLSESLQFHMAGILAKKLCNPFGTLNLSDTIVTPSDCTSIAHFLQQNRLHPMEDVLIAGRPDLTGLTDIVRAGGCRGLALNVNFSAEILKVLGNAIGNVSTLKHLLLMGIQSGPVTTAQWSHFQPAENTTLQHLGLWGLLDSESLAIVCNSLQNLHALEALALYGNSLSHAGLEPPLTPLLTLPDIRYIILQSCGLNVSDLDIVAELVTRNQLIWLDLTGNEDIADQGIVKLSSCLMNPRTVLVGLILDRCNISQLGVETLCNSLHNNQHLKILDFARNNVCNGAAAIVELLHQHTALEELDLADCHISAEGVYSLVASLMDNRSLKRLCIVANEMNSMEVSIHMNKILRNNHQIQVLELSKCGLTDDLLATICSSIKDKHSLKLLDVSQNPQLSAVHLIDLIRNTSLEQLCVAGCDLGPHGWKAVAEALLSNVHLVGCMAGDPGREQDLVDFLQELRRYPDDGPLQFLLLRGDSTKLASQVCQLERALHGRHLVSFVKNVWPFFMLSGLYWQALHPDIRTWISFANLEI